MKIKTFFKEKLKFQNYRTNKEMPFCLYDYQKNFVKKLDNHSFNYLAQDRQMGATVSILGYAIYSAVKNPEKQNLIVVQKDRHIKDFKDRIKKMYGESPSNIKIIKFDYTLFDEYPNHDVYLLDVCFMEGFDLNFYLNKIKFNKQNKLCITTMLSKVDPNIVKIAITTYWPYVLNENYNTYWANEMIHNIGQESFKIEYSGGYALQHKSLQTNPGQSIHIGSLS